MSIPHNALTPLDSAVHGTSPGRITYLSPPSPVSMADEWYGVASLEHFWIRRRFEVMCRLAGDSIQQGAALADIGCGHGILQRQIEDHFQRPVTGFDLNEWALQRTVSRSSQVCCYDLFERHPQYREGFDVIFLFDVLEHLRDEDAFVQAIRFHLAPSGRLLINVPALQSLWSKYDQAAGHFRRYNIASLRHVAERNGMRIRAWTYWGLALTPLLALRRLWLSWQPEERVIAAGFDSRGAAMNRMLLALARTERIPQHLLGSSLMAVLEQADGRRQPPAGDSPISER